MKKSLIVSLIAGALGALAIGSLWLAHLDDERREIQVPNGPWVRLVEMTYGPDFARRKSFLDQVRERLPFLERQSSASRSSFFPPFDHDSVGLWFHTKGKGDFTDFRFLLTGDDGSQIISEAQQQWVGTDLLVVFETFPRWANVIEVTPLDCRSERIVRCPEAFRFYNPSPSPPITRTMVAQTLPASSWDRGVEFRATNMLAKPPIANDGPAELSFVVSREGFPRCDWAAKILKVADESGYVIHFVWSEEGTEHLMFRNAWWGTGPWQINLEYYKKSHFESYEQTIVNVVIPPRGQSKLGNMEVRVNGVCVRIVGQENGPIYRDEEGRERYHSPLLQMESPDGMQVEILEVVDDQSRKVSFLGYSLYPTPDAKSLSVRFAVVPKYYAQLTLEPTAPKSGDQP